MVVQRHEGTRGALARLMNGARHQLLAGAGLSADQHRGVRPRHPLGHRQRREELAVLADHLGREAPARPSLEGHAGGRRGRRHAAAGREIRHHPIEGGLEAVAREGLDQEVPCACAKGGDRRGLGRVAGHDDRAGHLAQIAEADEELESVPVAEVQIEKQGVGRRARGEVLGQGDAVGHFDVVPARPELPRQARTKEHVVVDDEESKSSSHRGHRTTRGTAGASRFSRDRAKPFSEAAAIDATPLVTVRDRSDYGASMVAVPLRQLSKKRTACPTAPSTSFATGTGVASGSKGGITGWTTVWRSLR